MGIDEKELGIVEKKQLWAELFTWGETRRKRGDTRVVKRKGRPRKGKRMLRYDVL